MINPTHEFELASTGDEVNPMELTESSWRVTETYFGLGFGGVPTFTHRIELYQTDDQLLAAIPGDTLEEKAQSVKDIVGEIRDIEKEDEDE